MPIYISSIKVIDAKYLLHTLKGAEYRVDFLTDNLQIIKLSNQNVNLNLVKLANVFTQHT